MEQFAQGMTARQYVDQMSMEEERMLSTLDSTVIGAADIQILERYTGTRKILVITEDWCGTSLGSAPFVVKLAEAIPQHRDADLPARREPRSDGSISEGRSLSFDSRDRILR